jgi:SOS-response transcriptional repressor LexA
MSPTRFTDTQGQYLAFIDAYTRVHGRPPAETDMQRHFGVSPPSVHQMVLTLERLGLVRRQPGVARSIEVLLAPEDLPVLRHPEPVKPSVPRNSWVTCCEIWYSGEAILVPRGVPCRATRKTPCARSPRMSARS